MYRNKKSNLLLIYHYKNTPNPLDVGGGYCDKITMENHSNFFNDFIYRWDSYEEKNFDFNSIFNCLTSLVGISYASWSYKESQNDFNTLGSKCFEITMTKETEAITFSKV